MLMPKRENARSEASQTKSTSDQKKVLSKQNKDRNKGSNVILWSPASGVHRTLEPVEPAHRLTKHTDAARRTNGFEAWPVDNRFAFDAQDHARILAADRSCFRNKFGGASGSDL
jgi:hypothetical protein